MDLQKEVAAMFPKQLLVPQKLAGKSRPYAVFRPFRSIVGSALECQQVLLLPEIDSLCDEERHHAPNRVGQQEGNQRRLAIENRHEVFQTPKGVGACLAIACGKVKFSGQVLPTSHKITYDIQIKRVIQRRLIMGIADGFLSCDGKQIYSAENLEVGLFKK